MEGSPTFAGDGSSVAAWSSACAKRPAGPRATRTPTTGQYSGFDIEIARLVAAELGFEPDKIDYKVVPSADREDTIERGEIDYYVGTYTINDNRKQRVSFAGPYYVAGQDLLVRKDDTTITGQDTLKGKKVCSVTGSTPIQRIKDQQLTEAENIVEFETYYASASTSCSTTRSTRSPPTTRSSRASPRSSPTSSRSSASRSPPSRTASA